MPAGALATDPVPETDTLNVYKGTNVAVTPLLALMFTVQVPVPAHPLPLQPLKTNPDAGEALSVTAVPFRKVAEQVAPQLMPAGELRTDPEPEVVTVSVDSGAGENVAVTPTGDVPTLITQAPVPEQAPVHPAKIEVVGTAVGVSVTPAPEFNVALQVPEAVPLVLVQLIPPTLLVTLPEPAPAVVTVTA